MTMFTEDGAFDQEGFDSHLEYLIGEGANGLVIGGTTGEFIGLDDEERRRVIVSAVGAVRGRVPVLASTGYYSTRASIDLTRFAAEAGADGVLVILPYYQKPSRIEVMEHFRAVGASSRLPVVLYNNSINSGTPSLEVDDIERLYEDGAIHGLKSSANAVQQVHEVRAAVDDAFRIFYGSFNAPIEGAVGGADGWLSGILNVATADAVQIWSSIQAQDLDAARRIWRTRVLPIKYLYTKKVFGGVSDQAIYRAILDLRGRRGGFSRAPLRPLSADQRMELQAYLDRAGLL